MERFVSASCVIPAYNAAETIGRALESVFRTPGIKEVIVVDDGSSDDTAARVEALARNAPLPVRLIRQKNAGASTARNVGMAAVSESSYWITFLDADDEMLTEAITSKSAHLASCPDPESVDAVHGSFLRGGGERANQEFAETRDRVDPDGIGRVGGFPGGVPSYIFRREPLLITGGFRAELNMFEDFELVLRFIAKGARVVGCNVPGFHRNYTVGSLSRGAALPKRLRIERQFLSIAARDGLMSQSEITRRRLRNRARQLFHAVMGR